MSKPIALGTLLANRYYLLRCLGDGEFGWQYSAVDRERDNRLCLLEDWLPPSALLPHLPTQYRSFQARLQPFLALRHAQIASPKATILAQNRFWLVYDYPEGKTYGELLDDRRSYQAAFTEAEVIQLLQQILPLLQHLHEQDLVHCNLHLDSLFLPDPETLPYLTNLGQLREIALDLGFQSLSPDWAPPELPATIAQDLYDLGAIAVQLLSATPPTTSWERYTTAVYATLSPAFTRVLKRMLLPNPLARYATAQAVLEALQRPPITSERLASERLFDRSEARSKTIAASRPVLSSILPANSEAPWLTDADSAIADNRSPLPTHP
ncbi:protein kinase domain-containing protein, partial [Alkalinema pantanalense CENA528]|uniref:protein kinase domain-containing protein n=1 Tax=Alkalinema pantanalense TaxID=1620705 RepID=UPI003D6ECBB4